MSLKNNIKKITTKAKNTFSFQDNKQKINKSEIKGINICIVCFPKSGSTYISELLSEYTGFKRENYVHAWGRREQEWERKIVERLSLKNVVVQQHTRGSEACINLMKEFDIQTVILVRNIFDVIPSLMDHFQKESVLGPAMYLDKEHLLLPEADLSDMIIDMAIPWYFNFYVSWYYQSIKHNIPILTYEDFFSNQEEQFMNLCSIFKLEYSKSHYLLSCNNIKQRNSRFNLGKTGRGKEKLTIEQIKRIEKFANYYPDVNFTKIGIN